MDREIRKRLPKAPLIEFGWSWSWFYFHKFRLANCIRWQIGWLTINHRAPWLEHSARALHPEVFKTLR